LPAPIIPIIATVFFSRTLFIPVFHGDWRQRRSLAHAKSFFLEWRELAVNAIYNRIQDGLGMIPRAQDASGAKDRQRQQSDFGQNQRQSKRHTGMGRLIKAVVVLAVLGFAGLAGYAYLADMTPPATVVKQPVVLHAQ
jgi:hypothetical protein